MRVFIYRDYDRFAAGRVHVFERHIGMALCRNKSAYGFPADAKAFSACERAKVANKEQLKSWARGVSIPTTGKTSEELKVELLEIAEVGS